MDIQDLDYYRANTFAYNGVGDIAWKKETGKKSGTYSLLWNNY